MVNNSNVHDNCKQMVHLEQTGNCFRLNPQVFANNNVKLHSFHQFRLTAFQGSVHT